MAAVALCVVALAVVYATRLEHARRRVEALGGNLSRVQGMFALTESSRKAAVQLQQASLVKRRAMPIGHELETAHQEGDIAGVVDSLIALMDLSRSTETEVDLTSFRVRAALLYSAFDRIHQFIPSQNLDPVQRERLVRHIGEIDIRPHLTAGIAANAAEFRACGDGLPYGDTAWPGMTTLSVWLHPYRVMLVESRWGTPARLSDLAHCLELFDRLERLSALPYWEYQAQVKKTPLYAGNGVAHERARVALSGKGALAIPAIIETMCRMTRVGLAIEAVRDADGVLPATLAEVPGLSPADSVDPCTGQSLRFVHVDDGFLLYGLGPNQSDEGGQHQYLEGDIVWRGASH